MKKTILIFIFIVLLAGGFFYFSRFQGGKIVEEPSFGNEISADKKVLNIILSPHFDDGVLSLGGLMARNKDEFKKELLVATFFTRRPAETMHTQWDKISGFSDSGEAMSARTKENEKALVPFSAIIKNYNYSDFQYRKKNENEETRQAISKDIETLLENYNQQEIFIYGPATFGEKITHPDHQIVHDSLMDIWQKNRALNVQFFMYEDFPYAQQFAMSNPSSLNAYLEEKEKKKLKENPIELNQAELAEKITGIYAYESQVKAFKSFGDDIGILAEKFFTARCNTLLPRAFACEVLHQSP